MNNLIEEWRNRYSYYLAKAEEAFFDGDMLMTECCWDAAARQWKIAVDELENAIIDDLVNGEKQ